MKNKIFASGAALLFLAGINPAAQATSILYETSNLGGNRWQYSYTIENDRLASAIEEFTIFFTEGDYANLSVLSAPPGWDPLVIDPDPALPDDGFFDALADPGLGIAPGSSLDGFLVSFDFLGAGRPGAQSFDIIDPATFAVLDSGTTTAAVVSVPLAPAWLLYGLGLTGLAVWRRYAAAQD